MNPFGPWILCLAASVAGCGGNPEAATTPAPADATGGETRPAANMANPASVYCREVGGTLQIRRGDGGEVGICAKDGNECEEWLLYRGECPAIAAGHPATADQ